MLPLNDTHLELYRLERTRWSLPTSDFIGAEPEQRTRAGLRYRLGNALIASGRALTGPAPAERRTSTHNRPVSAHR